MYIPPITRPFFMLFIGLRLISQAMMTPFTRIYRLCVTLWMGIWQESVPPPLCTLSWSIDIVRYLKNHTLQLRNSQFSMIVCQIWFCTCRFWIDKFSSQVAGAGTEECNHWIGSIQNKIANFNQNRHLICLPLFSTGHSWPCRLLQRNRMREESNCWRTVQLYYIF